MTTLLWIFSFILHGVSLLIMILLFTRLGQIKTIEKNQRMMMKDMEDLLTAHITEMKDENEAFLEKAKREQKRIIGQQNTETKKGVSGNKNEIQTLDLVEAQLTETDIASLFPRFEELDEVKLGANEGLENEVLLSKEDRFELLPIGQQARILYNNGLSLVEIAKKLGKGKTEIELFLKFNV